MKGAGRVDITVNGKRESILQDITVMDLLKSKEFEPNMVSIEINQNIIDRTMYGTTKINEGDIVEFLFYMGGGNL